MSRAATLVRPAVPPPPGEAGPKSPDKGWLRPIAFIVVGLLVGFVVATASSGKASLQRTLDSTSAQLTGQRSQLAKLKDQLADE